MQIGFPGASTESSSTTINNVGQRIFGGRMAQDYDNSTTQQTWEIVAGVPVGFDAVRPIFAQSRNAGGTTGTATITCIAAPLPSTTDTDINAATFTNVTFAGAATGALPAATAVGRRSFLVGDWVPIASVARNDGGTLPLVTFRYTAGAVILTGLGNGAQNFTNWGTHPSGRIWRARRKAGDFVTANQATFSSGSAIIGASFVLVGFQYLARGQVINMIGFGDSITEGQGTYIGEGWGFPAAVNLSGGDTGVTYEWSNLGWAGQATPNFRDHVTDAVAANLVRSGDVVFIPNGSPNDISTTISAAAIAQARGRIATALATVQTGSGSRGARMVPWTWMPSNTSIKAYGATDSLRRAYNDELRSWANRGAVIADYDALIAGVDDGTGQIQMKAGSTTDNIHPNDTGNALLVPVAMSAVRRAAPAQRGQLVAA